MTETPRPLTRGEQRRQRASREAWAGFKADMRMEHDLLVAQQQDWSAAVKAGQVRARDGWGDLPHLLLAIATGGLWAPVWIYVAVRNNRRVRRTGPGKRAVARRKAAKVQRRVQLQERRRRVRAEAREDWARTFRRR